MLTEIEILRRLRDICLALPGAVETVSFGHPTFKVNGRTFSVFEKYKGELGICVKIEKELQGMFLDDSRFFRTPYIGKHGWVTLRVYAARLIWSEVKDLVRGSYRLALAGRPPRPSSKRSSRTPSPHRTRIC